MIKLLIRKKYKTEIDNMIDYLEGRIDSVSFVLLYFSSTTYKKIINFSIRLDPYKKLDDEFDAKLKCVNIDFYILVHFQSTIDNCLKYLRIKHKIVVEELRLWEKWFFYVPYFLDPDYEVLCELEKIDSEKSHTKRWYRNYFLQTYKCKKFPPSWLQWCEWPMDDDGRPCLFLYQTGFPNRHDFIEYHFRKSNGEEIVIEQYD